MGDHRTLTTRYPNMNGVACRVFFATVLFIGPLKAASTGPAAAAEEDSAEFPTYVDDDYEYEKPSSKRSDHLLRFARRLNGNDDDIFAKRGGDDHFLRFAKRGDDHLLRFAKSDHFLRFAKAGDDHFLRFAKAGDDHFLRFAKADDHLLRFAKRAGDDHLLRFARADDDRILRFAKSWPLIRGARDQTNGHMLRFSKRSVPEDQIEEQTDDQSSHDDHLLRFAKRSIHDPFHRYAKSGDDHFLRFA